MDARDFHRDLSAWIDGELPAERAAAMQAAAEASPELGEEARLERAFQDRMRRALLSDPGSVEAVQRMAARARREAAPEGRLLTFPRRALRIAASFLVVAASGMWWLCIPPFECSYMQALERAAEDPLAAPGPAADGFLPGAGLPAELAGHLAAPPAALARLDFFGWHLAGVRQDYVRADGSAVHVIVCERATGHPSVRRRVARDGLSWWMADLDGRSVVAFTADGDGRIAAVTGAVGDPAVYAAARELRDALR